MTDVYLTNTLTHKKEKFIPIKEGSVGVYSCGPTVYWNQHIGHMYCYVHWDSLVRFFRYLGNEVKWVMNITDVGHMTSDEDRGEDKMEKGAKREGVSVWQVADKYITQFKESLDLFNIKQPDILCRATEHIAEQIELIKKIEKNGFTYKTKTGLIFDTCKFPDYAKFARLNLTKQTAGARVEIDPEKKQPWDFMLWITNQPEHIMQWDSPWGRGFPGWHIECTAMSAKYLGEHFDIHTGGKEHIPVHHTNEIAQAFGAFNHQTANYWLHNEWLFLKEGGKMSKSAGNFVTAQDLVAKGYNPLVLRYLFLNSHYRKGLRFSFEALNGAQIALNKLREIVRQIKNDNRRKMLSAEKLVKVDLYRYKFIEALSDDLNVPKALAVLWEMLKSNITGEDKYDFVLSFDEVLGLGLGQMTNDKLQITNQIQKLIDKREKLRQEGKFIEADRLRKQIERKGFLLKDTAEGTKVESS